MPPLDLSVLPAYAVASAILAVTPGPDTFTILRTVTRHGWRAGAAAYSGILTGILCWAILLISGVGLLISRNPTLMEGLRWAGAAYLAYLAYTSFRGAAAFRNSASRTEQALNGAEPQGKSLFTIGLLSNLLNPKVLLFSLAFIPQFLGHATSIVGQLTILCLTGALVSLAWNTVLILGAARVTHVLSTWKFRLAMDIISGAAFTTICLVLAFTEL